MSRKFVVQQVSRPAEYDRNATVVTRQAELPDVAPHSRTSRWSYTVPTSRRAWLEAIHVRTFRKTAPTAAGNVVAAIEYTQAGGSAIQFERIVHADGTAGVERKTSRDCRLLMMPGDMLECVTADSSTGGTNDFTISAKLTEFDA